MSKQDGNTTVFAKTLAKVYDRYFQTSRKFCNISKEFVDSLTK